MTSGIFTDEARRFAARNDIILIDGRQLTAVIGQQSSSHRATDSQPGNGNDNTQSLAEPTCPRCAATMVERKASRGAAAGRYFWVCSRYPSCPGTRSAEGSRGVVGFRSDTTWMTGAVTPAAWVLVYVAVLVKGRTYRIPPDRITGTDPVLSGDRHCHPTNTSRREGLPRQQRSATGS